MQISGVIDIKKAIVHILNKNTGLVMSDYKIELDDKIKYLITKHISNSIIHKSRTFATFSGDENLVRESCIDIFNNNENFIDQSKCISRQLFLAMKKTSASSANLLIVYFTQGNKEALGIIKLDFSENFYTDKIEVNGKMKVVVKVQGNGFSGSQKLEKCAIINEDIKYNENDDFLLLDAQNGDNISDYFRNTFLNCELINDDKINTKEMIKEINCFINEEYKNNNKELVDKTFQFTSYLEKNKRFKIDELLIGLFQEETVRNKFKDKIKNKRIDFEFNIHESSVERKLKNRTIVTESGISLKAKASLFNSNDIIIEENESNGYCDIILKNVKIDKNKV